MSVPGISVHAWSRPDRGILRNAAMHRAREDEKGSPRVCVGSIELPASALALEGAVVERRDGTWETCTPASPILGPRRFLYRKSVTADRFAAPESRHRLPRRFRGPKPVTTVRIVAAESEHPPRRRSTTALQSHATVTQRAIDPHKPEENPESRAPRERYGRGRCAARGDSNGMDHPPLVDLSALASTRPTSPVVPEGMAGDAALSARLRVAPLRSRHEGIRPNRSGRIRIDCAGPLVKTLYSEESSWPKPGRNPPRPRPSLTRSASGEPGAPPTSCVIVGWVPGEPVTGRR